MNDPCLRLDQLLRSRGAASKKETRALIDQGRITVDGVTAQSACMRIADSSVIAIDGVPVPEQPPVYLMLHKPAGVLCTNTPQLGETVLSLLREPYASMRLFPVGRLDKDTEGLLLLTGDGDFCRRITRPEHDLEKKYFLTYHGTLVPDAEEILAAGAVLKNGIRCKPAKLLRFADGFSAEITITEGKYHEVKRLISHCGAKVAYLRRLSIGGLELDPALPKGAYRELTKEEMDKIFEH